MTIVIQATAPTSFEIKSANLPLVALLLKSPDLAVLSDDLSMRFGDIPDFFDHDPLVIDLGPLQSGGNAAAMANADIDFAGLADMLRRYRLCPIAVKGGSPQQMAAALAAGLVAAHDTHLLGGKPQLVDVKENRTASESPTPAAQPVQHAPPPAVAHGALIIDKPLRSGQQVYARGRDLVVMAMVNAGAEVIADGHIHVYAPLRGRAMAGARGNVDARIFSLALDAELLSIAGVYRTSDKPLPASVLGQPTQVRLVSGTDGDKLVMEKMA